MAISAIKGLGKAFIKRSRAKAAEKMKKLNKRDTLRFQGVYKKHRKMLERLNKPAKDELDKTLKSIKGRITKGKSKDDMKDMNNGEVVFVATTVGDYKVMAEDMQELKRYIKQMGEVIVYYRNVTMPNGEQGVGAKVKKNETNSD